MHESIAVADTIASAKTARLGRDAPRWQRVGLGAGARCVAVFEQCPCAARAELRLDDVARVDVTQHDAPPVLHLQQLRKVLADGEELVELLLRVIGLLQRLLEGEAPLDQDVRRQRRCDAALPAIACAMSRSQALRHIEYDVSAASQRRCCAARV